VRGPIFELSSILFGKSVHPETQKAQKTKKQTHLSGKTNESERRKKVERAGKVERLKGQKAEKVVGWGGLGVSNRQGGLAF
jgi:hypothetical protein